MPQRKRKSKRLTVDTDSDSDDQPLTARSQRKLSNSQQVASTSKKTPKPKFASQVPSTSKKTPKPKFATQVPEQMNDNEEGGNELDESEFVVAQLGNNLTDFEKESLTNKAVQRICKKFFINQKSFKTTSIFFPADKIKPKQQEELMSSVNDRLKELTTLELAVEQKKYIVHIPKERKDEIMAEAERREPLDLKKISHEIDGIQTISRPDKCTPILLSITLALVYFYRGRVREDELVDTLLPKVLPKFERLCTVDITKMLQDFEHRAFILRKHTKRDGDTMPKTYIYWGFRAKHEISKKSLLPIYTLMSGNKPLPHWLSESIEKDIDFFND